MKRYTIGLITTITMLLSQETQQVVMGAPERTEGEGPFDRLIIRGGILIDGTGAPPRGPVDIVIERNRIVKVVKHSFFCPSNVVKRKINARNNHEDNRSPSKRSLFKVCEACIMG